MILPSHEDLKAQVTGENLDHKRRVENLKTSLKTAYKTVAKANRSSHQNNKKLYDRKAKTRKFEVEELVYLYNPAMKPGRSRKFYRPWAGPFKVTQRISELNYEIMDQKDKKQAVHINRLKKADNPELWKLKAKQKPEKKLPRTQAEETSEAEDSVWKPKSPPLPCADYTVNNGEHENPPGQSPVHPISDTPTNDNRDPTYYPSDSPRSRCELQSTRNEPPVTRSRTRILSQTDIT